LPIPSSKTSTEHGWTYAAVLTEVTARGDVAVGGAESPNTVLLEVNELIAIVTRPLQWGAGLIVTYITCLLGIDMDTFLAQNLVPIVLTSKN